MTAGKTPDGLDLGGITCLWSLCERRAETHPDRVVLDFDGGLWTWRQLFHAAEQLAGGLASVGVKAGDVVCQMSRNHPEAVVTMLALLRLGAIECPVNAGLRGHQLAHVLDHSCARVLIVEDSLVERFVEQLSHVGGMEVVVLRASEVGTDGVDAAGDPDSSGAADPPTFDGVASTAMPGASAPDDRASWISYDKLRNSRFTAPSLRMPRRSDPMNIIYTSGTTGPAKGAVLPQAFPIEQARIKIEQWGLTSDDVMFSALPLYHVNARFSTLCTALVVNGRAALVSRFSARSFWDQVRHSSATEVGVVGAVSSILLRQEPGPKDRDHQVRMMHGAAGIPVDRRSDFEERFGLRLVTGFAMTETGHFSTTSPDDPMRFRASGRPVPQYEVAVVDVNDHEVPPGTVGELVVRPRRPGVMMKGYHREPEVTLRAFRNLWFHTGDLATIEADGYIRWVDRAADAIRRRGEMISSTEVERAVCQFEGVAECAAVGVASDLGEQEVKLVVVAEAGGLVDPDALVRHCQRTLPDFCQPRYLEVRDELPKGATHKVIKQQLRNTTGPNMCDLLEARRP